MTKLDCSEENESRDDGRSAFQSDEPLSLDATMWRSLPELIKAVNNHWQNYRIDPSHDRIDQMRKEVQLLLYWLARRTAKRSAVYSSSPSGVSQRIQVAGFDGMGPTELSAQLYLHVCERKSVTELVEGAQEDLVAYLARILSNAKTEAFRAYQTRRKHVGLADDILAPGENDEGARISNDALDVLASDSGHSLDVAQIVEAMQCLSQFAEFIEAQQINAKLQLVAWALWMATPLSDKSDGDISENKNNTDAVLAEEIGMPKKTFDKYKPQARLLVERFRQEKGW